MRMLGPCTKSLNPCTSFFTTIQIHTLSLTHIHTLSLTHTHTLSLSHTHTHTHTLSLSLSLSLTHTLSHTHVHIYVLCSVADRALPPAADSAAESVQPQEQESPLANTLATTAVVDVTTSSSPGTTSISGGTSQDQSDGIKTGLTTSRVGRDSVSDQEPAATRSLHEEGGTVPPTTPPISILETMTVPRLVAGGRGCPTRDEASDSCHGKEKQAMRDGSSLSETREGREGGEGDGERGLRVGREGGEGDGERELRVGREGGGEREDKGTVSGRREEESGEGGDEGGQNELCGEKMGGGTAGEDPTFPYSPPLPVSKHT